MTMTEPCQPRSLRSMRAELRRAKKLLKAAERELAETGSISEETGEAMRRELITHVRRRNSELLAGEAAGNA